MTREEEIKKESKNRYPYIKGLPQTSAHKEIFIEGAKWADRTMVERAICFIEDAVCDATIETGNIARLIENFKEAMGYEN